MEQTLLMSFKIAKTSGAQTHKPAKTERFLFKVLLKWAILYIPCGFGHFANQKIIKDDKATQILTDLPHFCPHT